MGTIKAGFNSIQVTFTSGAGLVQEVPFRNYADQILVKNFTSALIKVAVVAEAEDGYITVLPNSSEVISYNLREPKALAKVFLTSTVVGNAEIVLQSWSSKLLEV